MCQDHHKEKRNWTRRHFIQKVGFLTGASMFMSPFSIRALAKNPISNLFPLNQNKNILVLIQLKGGNDGLNTIIPLYDYGFYKSKRPKIHIPKSDLISLNNDFAIPNSMKPLKSLWDKGMMKIVNGVGYPNPNLSHFRSADIWATGSSSQRIKNTGWLGRYLAHEYPNYQNQPPEIPAAIQIGEDSDIVFESELGQLGFTVEDPKELYEIAQSAETFSNVKEQSYYHEELQFLRTVSNSTFNYTNAIKKAESEGQTKTHYESDPLSQQLKLAAKLIKGNLGTTTYLVSLDGFDTHAQQSWKHQDLLRHLSNAIHSFYMDLSTSPLDQKVLTMTYSEFGRRIEENGSKGTDHGTAAPMLFFGKALGKSNIIGTPCNLQKPDNDGNLQFTTDFRSVYSTILKEWLGVNQNNKLNILGGNFKGIPELI